MAYARLLAHVQDRGALADQRRLSDKTGITEHGNFVKVRDVQGAARKRRARCSLTAQKLVFCWSGLALIRVPDPLLDESSEIFQCDADGKMPCRFDLCSNRQMALSASKRSPEQNRESAATDSLQPRSSSTCSHIGMRLDSALASRKVSASSSLPFDVNKSFVGRHLQLHHSSPLPPALKSNGFIVE